MLRAATTSTAGNESQSYVTVLATQGGRLEKAGQVGGLGRGERIYAVRFIGDRGYVVTFRQTDPLYTLDLADPAHPRVTGELKILGYSAYLHPVGEHELLGVGQDATPEGVQLGTQVSLFDVSDPAAPRLLHRAGLGGSTSSDVEFDHHAFLWWAPKRLAVVPVSDCERRARRRRSRSGSTAPPASASAGRTVERADVLRTLVVGGRLFTLTARGCTRTTSTRSRRGRSRPSSQADRKDRAAVPPAAPDRTHVRVLLAWFPWAASAAREV